MDDDRFDITKQAVLAHVQAIFEEMEEEMALSHQEKYALLEDSFENATDVDELQVAFEQWYNEHAQDLSLAENMEELWEQAVSSLEE